MKDFEWRKRYAPYGYQYVKHRIDFATLEFARFPAIIIESTIEYMQAKIAKDCPYFFDVSNAQTRLSVYPKDVGETLNHLDPLKPRLGLEIEIRQPMPKDMTPSSLHY